MQVVVADTGRLHYLVLIEATSVLPRLFGSVRMPEADRVELSHARTSAPVRTWLATQPAWLTSRATTPETALPFPRLGKGERAAIALAQATRADLLQMGDRAGTVAARSLGFRVMGTLGIRDLAARQELIDLAGAFARLRSTSFRCRPEIMDAVLARHEGGRRYERGFRDDGALRGELRENQDFR